MNKRQNYRMAVKRCHNCRFARGYTLMKMACFIDPEHPYETNIDSVCDGHKPLPNYNDEMKEIEIKETKKEKSFFGLVKSMFSRTVENEV